MAEFIQGVRANGRGLKRGTTVQTSAGAGDADKIPSLNSNGQLDPSMIPNLGILSLPANEALAAGSYVNIFDSGGGVAEVRLADNSNGREAFGYVTAAVAAAATATVYTDDMNDGLTGLTPGLAYFLGTAGGVVPEASRPTAVGTLDQFLGYAVAADTIETEINDPVEL